MFSLIPSALLLFEGGTMTPLSAVEGQVQRVGHLSTLGAQVRPAAKPVFFLAKRMWSWAGNPCQSLHPSDPPVGGCYSWVN